MLGGDNVIGIIPSRALHYGIAGVKRDEGIVLAHENQSIGALDSRLHRLRNPGRIDLKPITSDLGESVIIRLKHNYNRACIAHGKQHNFVRLSISYR